MMMMMMMMVVVMLLMMDTYRVSLIPSRCADFASHCASYCIISLGLTYSFNLTNCYSFNLTNCLRRFVPPTAGLHKAPLCGSAFDTGPIWH